MWLRRNFFLFLNGTVCVGLGSGFHLTHNTGVLSAQITSQSDVSQPLTCFSTEEPVPQHYILRGHSNPPRSSLVVFKVHCYNFVEDLRPSYTSTQVHRSYFNMY